MTPVRLRDYLLRKTTMADGKGAGPEPEKCSRPFMNRISSAFITQSCHQRVSVRLGIRQTTVAPRRLDS